jgi:hypothetical protein
MKGGFVVGVGIKNLTLFSEELRLSDFQSHLSVS